MSAKGKSFLSEFENNPAMQFITPPQEQSEPAKQDTKPQGRDQTEPQQITTQRFVYAEKKSQRVQLLMQPSIAQRAKAAADRLNISFNEYIYRAVLEKLEREETNE